MGSAHNSIWHRGVFLLCLLAMLLVSIPYANCAPHGSHAMANMAAGGCDPCCPASVSVTASCCLAHPQPAVPAVQVAQAAALGVQGVVRIEVHQQILTFRALAIADRNLPPPPRRTNLRI